MKKALISTLAVLAIALGLAFADSGSSGAGDVDPTGGDYTITMLS
jgi:hypothetical protein